MYKQLKMYFKNTYYEKKDVYLALLEYRNTPILKEFRYKSPCKFLMERKLYRNALRKKKYYDRHTKNLEDLTEGQEMVLKDCNEMT